MFKRAMLTMDNWHAYVMVHNGKPGEPTVGTLCTGGGRPNDMVSPRIISRPVPCVMACSSRPLASNCTLINWFVIAIFPLPPASPPL